MGNVRCKNCSVEFSSKEKYCPECGERRPAGGKRVKKSKNAAGKIIAAVVLIVLVVIVVVLLLKVLDNGRGVKTPDQNQPGTSDQGGVPGGTGDTGNPDSQSGDTLVLESIALDITEVTLRDGDNTVQLHATAYPEGVEAKIQWASNAPGVAIVDQNGLVTALSEGTAEIYAYCEDKIAVCMVYSYVTGEGAPSGGSNGGTEGGVKAGKLVVTSIYSSKPVSDITLKTGESVQLYLSNDGVKVSEGMTWTSNSAAVTVDDTGYVTANYAIGSYATLTVTYGGSSAEVIVRVR